MRKLTQCGTLAVALLIAQGALARPDPASIINAMDEDGDGLVSAEEFTLRGRGPGLKLLERADSNGDGRISRAEHDAVRVERAGRIAKWADDMFVELDADGDGYVTAAEAQRGAFERLDRDGDGYIDAGEFGRMRDRRPGGYPRVGGPRP